MKFSQIKILKLGGSAITNKTEIFSVRKDVLNRIAEEVAETNLNSLIIIHGGGSFGHPLAKQYKLYLGFKNQEQLAGFIKTRQAMTSLNKLVVDAFISKSVNVASIQPSSFIITKNGKITSINVEILKKLLKLGLIPILYGDVVVDKTKGFTILSGDQLSASLAVKFRAERVVLATDVDGIFTMDPKTNPEAELIPRINLNQLKKILKTKIKNESTIDVTGVMFGKLKEMIPVLKTGIKVFVVNAFKRGNIFKALTEREVEGTILEP